MHSSAAPSPHRREYYHQVQCITMVGLYISVWVKESLAREISHVHTKKIKGGMEHSLCCSYVGYQA